MRTTSRFCQMISIAYRTAPDVKHAKSISGQQEKFTLHYCCPHRQLCDDKWVSPTFQIFVRIVFDLEFDDVIQRQHSIEFHMIPQSSIVLFGCYFFAENFMKAFKIESSKMSNWKCQKKTALFSEETIY